MKDKIIIELIGFPGSGKTYLLSILNNEEKVKVITTDEFYRRLKAIPWIKKNKIFFKFALHNYKLLIHTCEYLIFCCSFSPYNLRRGYQLIKYYGFFQYIAKETKFSKVIFDQGILQFIWSLSFLNKKSPMEDSKYLKLMIQDVYSTFDSIYAYYKVDTELAASRAAGRNSDCKIDRFDLVKIKELYNVHKDDNKILMNYLPSDKKYFFELIDDFKRFVEICGNKDYKSISNASVLNEGMNYY